MDKIIIYGDYGIPVATKKISFRYRKRRMKRPEFQTIIEELGRLFPDEKTNMARYFQYIEKTQRVRFKKDVPVALVQAFHVFSKKKTSPPSRVATRIPSPVVKDIITGYYGPQYRRILHTAPEWAVIVYARHLCLWRPRTTVLSLTFRSFRVRIKKKGYDDTRDDHSHITMSAYVRNGRRVFHHSYVLVGVSTYDQDDYHFLADLYHLFTRFPIEVGPFINDELQDMIVRIRRDPRHVLDVIYYGLDLERLLRVAPTPTLLEAGLATADPRTPQRYSRLIDLTALRPDRIPVQGQEVDYGWQGQVPTRGTVIAITDPHHYTVRTGNREFRIDNTAIRFLTPARQSSPRMNFIQFLYKFPLMTTERERQLIAQDMGD